MSYIYGEQIAQDLKIGYLIPEKQLINGLGVAGLFSKALLLNKKTITILKEAFKCPSSKI